MIQIRVANQDDYRDVKDFYDTLIDAMEYAQFQPGWKKDVYPTQDFLIQSIADGQLYTGQLDGQIVACMVVNHAYNEGYNTVKWSVDAADSELFVIHALGVHPAYAGRGIAKQMVQRVIDLAGEQSMKTIRLDVLGGNLPAERAYMNMGFLYVDTLRMFYEDTGWTDFKVFEYIV